MGLGSRRPPYKATAAAFVCLVVFFLGVGRQWR
jgi:hypothetical protein